MGGDKKRSAANSSKITSPKKTKSDQVIQSHDEKQYIVLNLIQNQGVFNKELVTKEVDWFFGSLGLHDFYFEGTDTKVISDHIQILLAAKVLAQKSGKELDFKIVQEYDNGAFFASKSSVHGAGSTTRLPCKDRGASSVELIERNIEAKYLANGNKVIGDGVTIGLDVVKDNGNSELKRFRVQCYRSTGILDEKIAPFHLRVYFLAKPDFMNPNPSRGETDINQLADKTFLKRIGPNLKSIYQRIVVQASNQMAPVVDTEIWTEPDGLKMARIAIAHKVGSTHSYFSSIAEVYRAHGLYSTRKYVEFFSNEIVVYSFYLQQLSDKARGEGTFEERIQGCVQDASLHFVLPRTSLSPMLRECLLSLEEISYAYAAWKFTFHFLHRLPDGYTAIAKALREKDDGTFARLEEFRNTMKFNTFTEAQILEAILSSASIIKMLYHDFYNRFGSRNKVEADLLSKIKKVSTSELDYQIFVSFLTFNQHILRTNFFKPDKVALAFRLDGGFLSDIEYPEKPYAILFIIGSEFRGFHVRFLDIARGGIRMVKSAYAQLYIRNVSSLFDECYSLASTQQRKNKDIPEGGSKGVILLNLAHQDKSEVAFKKYIDALLDILLPLKEQVDKYEKEEILFLGPDEGTAHLMDWASHHAKSRGYRYWKAFTTGKSASNGGIPHDEYGMTTHSVRQYVTGIQKKLNLPVGKITKIQTGGPDGDLGSNEIKMSSEEATVAIVDGSGVLYDPEGINRKELLRLAEARSTVSNFNKKLISSKGYLVLVDQNDVKLPNGVVVENGTLFRNTYHLNPTISADFFVPCGGRPSAVNLSNVESFMYFPDTKKLRFKYIVEGANLFFTQDARLVLERAGVVLFKDASANKGGVTSSSLEVLAALALTDDEFTIHMQVDQKSGKKPEFYQKYVKEVQNRIDLNAKNEFECIWKEHEKSKMSFSVISNLLSEKITDLTISVQTSSLWNDIFLRDHLIKGALPKVLVDKIGYKQLMERLPESYTKSVFASQLASQFVYHYGLTATEFAFYEFVQKFLKK